MSEKKVALILEHIAEKIAPGDEIDLLPRLQARFQPGTFQLEKGLQMNTQISLQHRVRIATLFITIFALSLLLLFFTPQGRTLAQAVIQFFTRADSDTLPVQSFQQTPILSTTTPDPGDINNAKFTISQVEELAGYDVREPTWLPEILSFVGATYAPEKHITRLFYRDFEMNGLILREEPFKQIDDCELCGKVGASAAIDPVQIADFPGEYVEGVWKLTDQGPVWVSDPYLKTLRWQEDGIAFEIIYMGPPDNVTKADLIAIAESVR